MIGKIEVYQKEIDAKDHAVYARLEYYAKRLNEVRNLLKEHFFAPSRTQKLIENAQEDELVFSFNSVQAAMEQCLVDEDTFVAAAQQIKDSGENPYRAAILDHYVLTCGLPIQLQEELYLFKPEKSYTPLAQEFMRQFVYALSSYRIGLRIYDNYCALYHHEWKQTEPLQNYIKSAHALKQQADSETDLIPLYKKVKATGREIKVLIKAEKKREGLNRFMQDSEFLTVTLGKLLDLGTLHLESCYKEFPNNPIFWMIHDRSWHKLLKSLAGHLYADQYTYSTRRGTLEIYKDFIHLMKHELDQFRTVLLEKMPLIRGELLKESAKLVAGIKIDILDKLGQEDIDVIEALQEVGMFNTYTTLNTYALLLAQPQRPSWRVISEEDEDAKELSYFENKYLTYT